MNFKKLFKRETKVIAYVVIALTLVVIGTSYALFLKVNNNSNNQVVKAGSLTITYSQGNQISIDSTKNNCLTPQSDSSAWKRPGDPSTITGSACQFQLSVTNTGTLPMQYDLLLYDDTTGLPSGASRVNHNLIKIGMKSVRVMPSGGLDYTGYFEPKVLGAQPLKNGKRVIKTHFIEAGRTETMTLFLWISDTASVDIINQYVSLKLDVVGSVKEKDSGNIDLPVCKRATTLHTETCTSSSANGCYVVEGYNKLIRYGNLNTSSLLNVGDAFDCDVNGDGVFDPHTERFYYIKRTSDTAVLIYYSNVSAGVPTNNSDVAYGNNSPTTAITQLPTVEQWKNVKLSSTTRDLVSKDASTGAKTKLGSINYSGKAARLLDYEEITSCLDSTRIKSNCSFLLENAGYNREGIRGYWLETRASSSAWYASGPGSMWGGYMQLSAMSLNSLSGVRPVIEVPISEMNY